MRTAADTTILEHLRHIRATVDKIEIGTSALETRMLAAEGHLSSFFISQNRQSIEIERITRRLDGIEKKLAPSGS